METTINKILEILSECDDAIAVAQLVLTAVLTAKCSYIKKQSVNLKTSTSLEAIPVTEKVIETPTTSPISETTSKSSVSKKRIRADYEKRFQRCLDTFFSDKEDADLSAEELSQVDAVLTVLNTKE